jgi:hypothetical protein
MSEKPISSDIMRMIFGLFPPAVFSAENALVLPASAAADTESPMVPRKDRLDTLLLITPPFHSLETPTHANQHA